MSFFLILNKLNPTLFASNFILRKNSNVSLRVSMASIMQKDSNTKIKNTITFNFKFEKMAFL